MKAKKLIAALLVVMMVAVLLPIGALADENHMDKVSTLDEGFYVSVNGQPFTNINQTIKCGSGTAKLTLDGNGTPVLTLNNAAISKMDSLGTADGVSYYAGIAYEGERSLIIKTSGTNSITAPAASSGSKLYEGIYTYGGSVTIMGSNLSISGFGIGMECSELLTVSNCTISKCQTGIYANHLCLKGSNNINATGEIAVGVDADVMVYGVNTITLSNAKATAKMGMAANVITIDKNATLNITVNMDTTSLAVDEDSAAVAIFADGHIECIGKLNATVNLKDTGKVPAVAVGGNVLSSGSSSGDGVINAAVNVTGSAKRAAAISVTGLVSVGCDITAAVKGASKYDAALEAMNVGANNSVSIHATTDAKDSAYGAIVLGGQPCENVGDTNVYFNGKPVYPVGADYKAVDADGDTAYIVVDANGKPANDVVISSGALPFKDVKSTDYFADPVKWAYENGITNGTSAVTFGPNTTCTRAQVVTFLWRAMGCPAVENAENPFTDVKDGQWYTDAVLWAVENGITNGTSATTFSPNAKVTRAQTVTFLYRAANGTPVDASNPFKDVAAGEYYTDAVLWAVANGITNGTSASTFSPNKACTRGQIVTFLYRFDQTV